jgi:hypothetical protein
MQRKHAPLDLDGVLGGGEGDGGEDGDGEGGEGLHGVKGVWGGLKSVGWESKGGRGNEETKSGERAI